MIAAQSDAISNRALRIDVYDECLEPATCKSRGEVHGGCRLADTSLLADDREDRTHLLVFL